MCEDLRRVLRGETVSDFVQSDLGQTYATEQVTQIRNSAPSSAQISQEENETVVRFAPRSKNSNLTEKGSLRDDFVIFTKEFFGGSNKERQYSQRTVNTQPTQSVQPIVMRISS